MKVRVSPAEQPAEGVVSWLHTSSHVFKLLFLVFVGFLSALYLYYIFNLINFALQFGSICSSFSLER